MILATLLLLIAGAALIMGRVPFAKSAGRIAIGVVLIAIALPCLLKAFSPESVSADALLSGVSDFFKTVIVILLVVAALVLLGRWAFRRWLAAKPKPPVPASSRRRVDLPTMPRGWSPDDYEGNDR